MKKFLLTLCLLIGCATLHAKTATVNGITWSYEVSNGKATIYKGNDSPAISSSTGGAITIPSTLGGYPVTSIGYSAFRGCSSLTSVTIPEGVVSIGYEAFYWCKSLASVTIPSSVTSIEYGAFNGCGILTSFTFKGMPPSVSSSLFNNISSYARGYYLPQYASEWEAVIDSKGKWKGLTMMTKRAVLTLTAIGEGTVTGAGEYVVGDTVIVTATPNEGYIFFGWSTTSVEMETTYVFTMPEEAVTLTAYFVPTASVSTYITTNNLMSKEKAVQEALDANEVFTADEIKEMAFGSPVVEVKEDVIEIAISLQTAETLNAWQTMALQDATLEIDSEKGQIRLKVPKGDKKAAFYKFVVPTKEEAQENE